MRVWRNSRGRAGEKEKRNVEEMERRTRLGSGDLTYSVDIKGEAKRSEGDLIE